MCSLTLGYVKAKKYQKEDFLGIYIEKKSPLE